MGKKGERTSIRNLISFKRS